MRNFGAKFENSQKISTIWCVSKNLVQIKLTLIKFLNEKFWRQIWKFTENFNNFIDYFKIETRIDRIRPHCVNKFK